MVAVRSAASYLGQEALRRQAMKLTVAGVVQEEGRNFLGDAVTGIARDRMASSVGEVTVAILMREFLPLQAKTAMQKAITAVHQTNPGTSLADAVAPAETGLMRGMQAVARAAAVTIAKGTVSPEVISTPNPTPNPDPNPTPNGRWSLR